MKKIILILFCLPCLGALGQSNHTANYSKFDLGFSFSPDYSYRVLKASGSNSWMKEFYDTSEVSRFSYTGGINITYHFNKNLFFSSGVLFSDKGERTKKYPIMPVDNYYNHYYYLDIPLKANYYLMVKKIKLFLAAGLTANIFLNGQTNVAAGNSNEQNTMGLSSKVSRLGFSFVGGFGIDCPVTERWYFKLEPNYRRSIVSIYESPLKKYFYSFGFNVGLFCKL